ncbi:hypothetical protein Ctob_004691, partial [Chrysochromulina tobinii]
MASRHSIDLTIEGAEEIAPAPPVEEESAPAAKRRRKSELDDLLVGREAELHQPEAERRKSSRLDGVRNSNRLQQKALNGYKAALSEAEQIQSRLFRKLEAVEGKLDRTEEELKELKRASGKASAGVMKKAPSSKKLLKEQLEKLKAENKEHRAAIKQHKEMLLAQGQASTVEADAGAEAVPPLDKSKCKGKAVEVAGSSSASADASEAEGSAAAMVDDLKKQLAE